jgi:hypothetical protein
VQARQATWRNPSRGFLVGPAPTARKPSRDRSAGVVNRKSCRSPKTLMSVTPETGKGTWCTWREWILGTTIGGMRRLTTVFMRTVVVAQLVSCSGNSTSANSGPDAGAPASDVPEACRSPSPDDGPTSRFELLPTGTPAAAETCPVACGQSAWLSSSAPMIDVALPYGACAPGTADCSTLATMPCACGARGGPTHAFRCSCEGGNWICRIRSMGAALCGPCSDAATDTADGRGTPDAREPVDTFPGDAAELDQEVSPDAGTEPDVTQALPPVPCPQTVPSQGTECAQSDVCFYEDCSNIGRSRAMCVGSVWKMETSSCDGNSCYSPSGNFSRNCVAGQICVKHTGAIVMPECYDNPCIDKASDLRTCLTGIYPGCSIDIDLGFGATITCSDSRCTSGGQICQ